MACVHDECFHHPKHPLCPAASSPSSRSPGDHPSFQCVCSFALSRMLCWNHTTRSLFRLFFLFLVMCTHVSSMSFHGMTAQFFSVLRSTPLLALRHSSSVHLWKDIWIPFQFRSFVLQWPPPPCVKCGVEQVIFMFISSSMYFASRIQGQRWDPG